MGNQKKSAGSSFWNFFYHLGKNLLKIFTGANLIWQLLAIGITFLLVHFGFDWWYFRNLRNAQIYNWVYPATLIGFALPILLPFILFLIGRLRRDVKFFNTTFALGQAEILGWFISSLYKAFSGRSYPPSILVPTTTDITHVFKFGFWRDGIFWGWPSSHTTVAFAMSVCLIMLYPKYNLVKVLALIYAFYIGIGVSVSIHWFSDFAAGIIYGSVIGVVVGKSFYQRLAKLS